MGLGFGFRARGVEGWGMRVSWFRLERFGASGAEGFGCGLGFAVKP